MHPIISSTRKPQPDPRPDDRPDGGQIDMNEALRRVKATAARLRAEKQS
ncbi:hypothetical protein EHYA_07452 [Embleya hyalina]|uniref:Uncharacterized protein n=1 Tax=Embleya hyalina TaxID=516124 RepID=A0A401YYV3_9ACTN|nr:hypothetical protein EHYA_07452 [Embleya hyalina]